MTGGNLWVDRFRGLDDLNVIRKRTLIAAEPNQALMTGPPALAAVLLDAELARIFYPTDKACQIILEHVQRAMAFAQTRYPSLTSFLSFADPDHPPAGAESFWCLTGPAGVGKSAVMAALERLMPDPRVARVTPEYPKQPVVSMRRLVVKAKSSEANLMRDLGNKAVLEGHQRMGRSDLLKHTRQWLLTTGVCALACDELQFVTQSAQANTKVAQLLLAMSYLMVPSTYVANYSLVNRLKGRPQEEQQRLLAHPVLLLPDHPESRCWMNVLSTCLAAAPDAFDLDPETHGRDLHCYTAGLKRNLRRLLVLAFQLARSRGGTSKVSIADVRTAYRSSAFSVLRTDVEASIAVLTGDSFTRRTRSDLVCPIEGLDEVRSLISKAPDARKEALAAAVLRGALSKEERHAAESLRRAAEKQTSGKSDQVVVPLRKPKVAITVDELLRGSAAARRKVLSVGAKESSDEKTPRGR